MDRRQLLTLLTVGLASVLAGCDNTRRTSDQPAPSTPGTSAGPSPTSSPTSSPTPTATPTPTPSYSGPPFDATKREVLTSAGRTTSQIALTIDDGYDKETVAAYVEFVRRTGLHITFFPNGTYDTIWTPHAATLKPLIADGQVQIGNHTFHHQDLTKLSAAQITQELTSNEAWINKTFGTSSLPYVRPPYGNHNQTVRDVCGNLGYTKVVMWNGSFGDSGALSSDVLLQQARLYLKAGGIVLGHANFPTVTHLYDQIMELITSRSLTPVTLDEMFGSHRPASDGVV